MNSGMKHQLYKQLYNGLDIPVVGLGISSANHASELKRAVEIACREGYRHFDCAWINHNESDVGESIHNYLQATPNAKRQDFFIATKVWNNFHRRAKVKEKLEESLHNLQMAYVDLYYMHWPMAFDENSSTLPLGQGKTAFGKVDFMECYEGLEDCVDAGLARSIGLANFNERQLQRVLRNARRYKPAVLQIEAHPWNLPSRKLIELCNKNNIVMVANYPMGIAENTSLSELYRFTDTFIEPFVEEENIQKIGAKYGKTSDQVVLNFMTSLGFCVLPKSLTQIRLKERFDIFSFTLESEDYQYLHSLHQARRIDRVVGLRFHPDYPFGDDYESD